MRNVIIWHWFIKNPGGNMTSEWRRCDVGTSHRCRYDVMGLLKFAPLAPQYPKPCPSLNILNLAPHPPNILNLPTPMWLNNDLFEKELFIPFTVPVFRERFVNLCVCFFPFWFWGWDVGFGCNISWPLPFCLLCLFKLNYVECHTGSLSCIIMTAIACGG